MSVYYQTNVLWPYVTCVYKQWNKNGVWGGGRIYCTVGSELHVLIVNCTPHALMYVVSNTIILDILAMCLFSVFLLLLQIHVFDLNMSKYEPLCGQSGEERRRMGCACVHVAAKTRHSS